MDLAAHLQTALDVSQAALPAVGRYLIEGGPELALVCHQVAVYPGPITTAEIARCAYVTRPGVVVAYTKDCYPMVQTEGGQARPPDAAAQTAWSLAYAADVAALYDGLLEAALDGTFGMASDGCASVVVGVANFSGPRGGACSVRIPLTIQGT